MRRLIFVWAVFWCFIGAYTAVLAQGDTRPVAVFIGSSSIAQWHNLQEDFPSFRTVNLGVNGSAELPGGQVLPRMIDMIDREVVPLRPSVVIVYGGENDLWGNDDEAQKKSPKEVVALLDTFGKRLHTHLPKTRIVFISIKPSPSRWKIENDLIVTNFLMKLMVFKHPNMRFVDIYVPMLNDRGEPDSSFYSPDSLHLSAAGYKLWKDAVINALK